MTETSFHHFLARLIFKMFIEHH